MRLTTRKDALLDALSRGKSLATKRAHLPILGCVLLTANNGQLSVASTDLEVAVIAGCEANISKKGSIVVNPDILEKVLKRMAVEDVTLIGVTKIDRHKATRSRWNNETQQNENYEETVETVTCTFKVEAGNVSLGMDALPAKNFPGLPTVKGKGITVKNFDKVLDKVMYAVAVEDNRPVLNGVYLHKEKRQVRAAAADGFRLAIAPVETKGTLKRNSIIPLNACKTIRKLMPGDVTVIELGDEKSPRMAFHQGQGLAIVSMLIQGTFPHYEQLVPQGENRGKPIEFSRDELAKAIDIALSIMPAQDKNKRVILNCQRGKLTVIGKAETTEISVDIKPAKGNARICFNGLYLRDLVKITGEKFKIFVSSEKSPGVVTVDGSTHVLMPVHI